MLTEILSGDSRELIVSMWLDGQKRGGDWLAGDVLVEYSQYFKIDFIWIPPKGNCGLYIFRGRSLVYSKHGARDLHHMLTLCM